MEEEKIVLKATKRALEKLKEMINGSKEKFEEFTKNILEKGIRKEDYSILFQNQKGVFYYHKCKNIYVIFVIERNEVTIVDFLTDTEFNEVKGK